MGETKKIKYVRGDLFKYLKPNSNVMVPHVTNIFSVMGSGFAAQLAKLYPKSERTYKTWSDVHNLSESYHERLEEDVDLTLFTKENFGYFGHMTIQTGLSGSQNRNATYPDLMRAMKEVAEYCPQVGTNKIWSCKFGAGLCGMNWNFIEELIKDIWLSAGLNVTIFVLPESK